MWGGEAIVCLADAQLESGASSILSVAVLCECEIVSPQAYERGVALFKWPHVYDIWNTYLTKFIKRYVSALAWSAQLYRSCDHCVNSFTLGRKETGESQGSV